MRLFSELFGADEVLTGARVIWNVDGESYLQGIKSVVEFTQEKIVVRTGAGLVVVQGNALTIKKYADGDLQIGGRVTSLSLPEKGGEQG